MRIIILFLLSEYILSTIEGFLEAVEINGHMALTYYYYLPAMWGEYMTITLHINHIIYVLILTFILCKYIPKRTT